jgi:hypothetical protein
MADVSRQTDMRPRGSAFTLIGIGAPALCGLAALPLLWRSSMRLAALLSYPYPHDGLEGTLSYEAGLLRAGQPLYQPLELHRFVSAPYPPLHPLLLGFVAQIAGPHIFWGGRLLSLVAALGVALLIVLIIRNCSGSWLAGMLGAALFLSAPPVLLWATRIKPDMLALLWTALGLYLAARAIRSPDADPPLWGLIGAAICFVLAFYTKQTAIAAPLAVGLALLVLDLRGVRVGARTGYIGRLPLRRRTVAFGLTYLILLASTLLLLDAVTSGQFSFHTLVMHGRASWSPYLLAKFVALLAPYWPALLLGLALLLRAIRDERVLVPACYLLLVPLSLIGAGKTGANHNHLLESLLALALAAGIAVGWAAEVWPRQLLAAALLGLFAIQLVLAYQPQPWYASELVPADSPERYLTFIRNTPGEILADDVALLYMLGRPLRYDDPSGMGPVAFSGVWDQRGLVEEISQRRFSAIMIPVNVEKEPFDAAGRWTPEMLLAIREHYQLKFHDTIDTYVPK